MKDATNKKIVLQPSQIVSIEREFHFEAAHMLPRMPDGHKCRRLHGHSFRFILSLRGPVDVETGILLDFDEIDRVVKPIIEKHLDHFYLNDVEGLENPTSENLCIWLWNKFFAHFFFLFKVIVKETCRSQCSLRRTDLKFIANMQEATGK